MKVSKTNKLFIYLLGFIFFIFGQSSFAATVTIGPNTVISGPTVYSGDTLKLGNNGYFVIKNGATLKIENCTLTGTISKNNPTLITMEEGNLTIRNSNFKIQTSGVDPHPYTQSVYYVLRISRGVLELVNNIFTVDDSFRVGFALTGTSLNTKDFQVVGNRFERFHGTLYLLNSDDQIIRDNVFFTSTYGNIVTIGHNIDIRNNSIYFSGNDMLGNAMDIIDSDNVTVVDNKLYTPTCHGIYILNSHGVHVLNNFISGGITYAMTILTHAEMLAADKEYITRILGNYQMKNLLTSDIEIKFNYMAQNRYGINATEVNNLNVSDNIFIQRFADAESRKFWTDNNVLFSQVTGLVWQNNVYKEAFTQQIDGDNSQSLKFVPYPASGGVVL